MDSVPETISCAEHGTAYPTFICEHLAGDPVQQWHCDYPSEDNPWPDAWCSTCHAEFVKEGEWNDKNEEALSARILCHHCYEKALAQSVDYLEGDHLEEWRSFMASCLDELHEKQDALNAEFRLHEQERWDWDQERADLVFSNKGKPTVTAEIQFVGSISTMSNTWLWAWANSHFSHAIKYRVKGVRNFGEKKGFPKLTVPKWMATEEDGWEMAAIAAHLLKARGVYRTPVETGFIFMIITYIRRE